MRRIIRFVILLLSLGFTATSMPQVLAGEVSTNAYFTLPVPEGFKLLITETNAGTAEFTYGRQHPGEKSYAVFIVAAREKAEENRDPKFMATKMAAFIEGYTLSMQRPFQVFTKKNGPDVMFAGNPFQQIEWEAEAGGKKVIGRLYVGYVNARRYVVRIQDLVPHAEKEIPLMVEGVKKLQFPKE
ncbi:MAG: hypothetical protein K0Q55_3289 [Verrucomicrobia bacterium]|nr:hypothetical protein [Verrucomicrobiota bacterium]